MKKTIITVLSLLVALIVIIYAYEFIFKKPIIESPTIDEVTFPAQKVELKEQHKDSSYTFAGMLDLPTPCHTFTTKTNQLSESKYQIQIDVVDPKKDIMCAQVITPKPYKVTFEAPDDVEVTVLIDGVEYETNRFQIPNDQNIDSFILEVKG
jgi:hypothetical protein